MLLPEDPLPIVLVGNKYDLLRDEDSVKRKAVAQCLRCVATRHAASVVMHARDEKELRRTFFLNFYCSRACMTEYLAFVYCI